MGLHFVYTCGEQVCLALGGTLCLLLGCKPFCICSAQPSSPPPPLSLSLSHTHTHTHTHTHHTDTRTHTALSHCLDFLTHTHTHTHTHTQPPLFRKKNKKKHAKGLIKQKTTDVAHVEGTTHGKAVRYTTSRHFTVSYYHALSLPGPNCSRSCQHNGAQQITATDPAQKESLCQPTELGCVQKMIQPQPGRINHPVNRLVATERGFSSPTINKVAS